MEGHKLMEKVESLTDLEKAILISAIAGEHCIIVTEEVLLNDLIQQLHKVARQRFDLISMVFDISSSTSVDTFSVGISAACRSNDHSKESETLERQHLSEREPSQDKAEIERGLGLYLPNILVLKGLSLASEPVQIQALELMRTKRIYTRTAIHTAPKTFLVVAIMHHAEPPLLHQLRDRFFISHRHDPGAETLWTEAKATATTKQGAILHNSGASVQYTRNNPPALLRDDDIFILMEAAQNVTYQVDAKVYLHNVAVFLRTHRAVSGGVSPISTRHLELLGRCLACLHNATFVSIKLIKLAAKRIYPHRITMDKMELEGSKLDSGNDTAVSPIPNRYSPEQVIDEVLNELQVPL